MAEINISNQEKHKRRPKKLSTRVDLTPMVDLGFLLITFFIFTTSMTEPKVMKLVYPDDNTHVPNITSASKTLNILLIQENKVGYYMGDDVSQMKYTGYAKNGIRKIIIDARKNITAKYGNPKELVILIKPNSASTYNNMVQIMDEMLINEVTRYVLMDLTEKEAGIVLR